MTSYTKQPTFDRATYLAAREAWEVGRFGPEWTDWRGMAGKAGIIFPPSGSPDDSWSAERPSQRAMLVRAIRETPRLLRWALTRPGIASWGDVIEHLLTGRDRMAVEADDRERDWLAAKAPRRGSPVSVEAVLGPIVDSLA